MVQFTFTLFAAAAWFRYCRQSMMLVCGNWIPFISEVDCYCSDLNLSEQFNFISCAHSTTTDHFPLPVVPATSKPKRISLLLPRNNIDTEPHSKFRTGSGSGSGFALQISDRMINRRGHAECSRFLLRGMQQSSVTFGHLIYGAIFTFLMPPLMSCFIIGVFTRRFRGIERCSGVHSYSSRY